MRRSGSSAREWVALSWPGPKSGPAWTAVWTQCSQVDSFVSECCYFAPEFSDVEAHVDGCLDESDVMEAVLRAIASAVHFRKTSDAEAADRMRGLVAPGDEIAPPWLIDESTEYSRVLHRQKAYLAASHHRDKTGKGDKGDGHPNKPPKGPKGPKAKAKKGDKGRGRGDEDE